MDDHSGHDAERSEAKEERARYQKPTVKTSNAFEAASAGCSETDPDSEDYDLDS